MVQSCSAHCPHTTEETEVRIDRKLSGDVGPTIEKNKMKFRTDKKTYKMNKMKKKKKMKA